MTIFVELSVIIVITTVVAVVMKALKQPPVVGYILSGILVGPHALNLLQSTAPVELLAKIGVAILLFIVGLNLNPEAVKDTGKISLLTGLGQVIFTAVIGFGLLQILGFNGQESAYAALALTFSSTIIILKLLSDKGDLQKLYGKIAVGFLLVQDLVAVLILLAVSVIGVDGSAASVGATFLGLFTRGAAAAVLLYVVSKYLLPKFSSYLAYSTELLFLFSIAWGLGLSALFYYLGFSIEIGALLAGVTLSVSSYADEISSRLKPLRDFFIVLFFVLLGAQIAPADLAALAWPALALSAFVLIGNPVIVIIIMNLLGYRTRTAFLAGLTVAQISEFSLILMALGLSLGHVSQGIVSLVTLVGVITIAVSTYLILYGEEIYRPLRKVLKILEWRRPGSREEKSDSPAAGEVIIFGYDRVGYDFVQVAQKLGAKFLAIDCNPAAVKKLQKDKVPFRFGDAGDVEFLEEIDLAAAKLVVSTVPDHKTNRLLTRYYRRRNSRGIIMVIGHTVKEAQALYLAGASYVIMPHYLGAAAAAKMIVDHGFDAARFTEDRNKHLARLTERARLTV